MKRRVVFEIMAVAAISLALGGSAYWATRDDGGQKETRGGVLGFPVPTDWPTPDLNKPQPGHHLVGPGLCQVPDGAVEVFTNEAAQKRGRVFDQGTDRYYVTANGRCVTLADAPDPPPEWISPVLEETLKDPLENVYPCQIPDTAVEVSSNIIREKGARVFDKGIERIYVLADGQCVRFAGFLGPFIAAGNPHPTPDWVEWMDATPSPTPME